MPMAGYTKLFNSILASTVWNEPTETRIVWITLLAMADKHGLAEGSLPGLAVFARLPIDAVTIALERLSAPDKHSRSKEYDGRRIEAVEGGWQILNHGKYRAKLSEDERRDYLRIKQQEYRARLKREQASTSVADVSDTYTPSTQAEADTEADTDPKAKARTKKIAAKPSGKKGPIFDGQRLTVFEWQAKNLTKMLGPLAEAFDVHEWFFTLDERMMQTNVVMPRRDGGQWLEAELVAECRRRGLEVAVAGQVSREAEAAELLAEIKRIDARVGYVPPGREG